MKESKIFNQDCLKTMSAIGKEKADLILTDPPYNLGLFMKNRDTNINAMRSNHFAGSGWDDLDFLEWKELKVHLKQLKKSLEENDITQIKNTFIKTGTFYKK